MLESVNSRLEFAKERPRPLSFRITSLLFIFIFLFTGCDTFLGSEPAEPDPEENRFLGEIPALQAFDAEEHCSRPLPQNASGSAIFIVCVPEFWNGDLVIYAHGLVSPSIEYPIITPETTELASLVGTMGYAFAATSYSTNGLAFAEGLHDVVDLVENAIPSSGILPAPNRVYLTGASEGGLITTLAAERFPEIFDGALATCGPTGSIIEQINFTGDFRILFDYFYPGLIPGEPFEISPEVRTNWERGILKDSVREAITQNSEGARQLLSVLNLSVDFDNISILQDAVIDGLNNSITTSNDAIEKLGGQPFSNINRRYLGANDDTALNNEIDRFIADSRAVELLGALESTGNLKIPYVNVHTTGDSMVPISQQSLYKTKTQLAGAQDLYSELSLERFGHCTFEVAELIVSFAYLVQQVTGEIPAGADQLTASSPISQELFKLLSKSHSANQKPPAI